MPAEVLEPLPETTVVVNERKTDILIKPLFLSLINQSLMKEKTHNSRKGTVSGF